MNSFFLAFTDPVEAEGEGCTGRVQEEILSGSDHVLPGQHPVAGQYSQVGDLIM